MRHLKVPVEFARDSDGYLAWVEPNKMIDEGRVDLPTFARGRTQEEAFADLQRKLGYEEALHPLPLWPTLDNWSLQDGNKLTSDPDCASPECHVVYLSGAIYGCPRYNDGTQVGTGDRIGYLSVKNALAVTDAGATYRLGKPSPHFAHFMTEHGYSLEDYCLPKEAK